MYVLKVTVYILGLELRAGSMMTPWYTTTTRFVKNKDQRVVRYERATDRYTCPSQCPVRRCDSAMR